MDHHPHTTDETGFDYMANSDQEEKDRDNCGILFAVVLVVVLTLFQYIGLY